MGIGAGSKEKTHGWIGEHDLRDGIRMDGDEWMHSSTDRGFIWCFLGITAYLLLPTSSSREEEGKGNRELQTIGDIVFRISLTASGGRD